MDSMRPEVVICVENPPARKVGFTMADDDVKLVKLFRRTRIFESTVGGTELAHNRILLKQKVIFISIELIGRRIFHFFLMAASFNGEWNQEVIESNMQYLVL